MQHQIHYDKKFYQDKKTGYWISTTSPRIRAHVWVWKYHWQIVPHGYHVHHINEDRSDNRIDNLELIHKSRHMSHHMSTEERKEFSRKQAEKIRPLTKAWHASEEGREWHRKHGIECWKNKKEFEISCKQCNAKAITKTYHQEFCSNACKSKWRRDNHIDDVEKLCPMCNQTYKTNKYSRSKTCGSACGRLFKS